MKNNNPKYFSKKINIHDKNTIKHQDKFNHVNNEYISNILLNIQPKEMSSNLLSSIEESYILSYYYKLRILALEQINFFKNK